MSQRNWQLIRLRPAPLRLNRAKRTEKKISNCKRLFRSRCQIYQLSQVFLFSHCYCRINFIEIRCSIAVNKLTKYIFDIGMLRLCRNDPCSSRSTNSRHSKLCLLPELFDDCHLFLPLVCSESPQVFLYRFLPALCGLCRFCRPKPKI